MNEPDLLTTREAARRVGVSTDTIRRWARIGALPIANKYGLDRRYYRFRAQDVDRMVTEA